METEPAPATKDELALVERLRTGDESAFMSLVDGNQAAMLRIARMYVSSQAIAEEVVQDAWLGILKGIDRFEGRSSLRTWMFRILANIAKTRGQRESRSVPFSSLAGDDLEEPSVDASWFLSVGADWEGHWSSVPDDWSGVPEERLVGGETLSVVRKAIEKLPPMPGGGDPVARRPGVVFGGGP